MQNKSLASTRLPSRRNKTMKIYIGIEHVIKYSRSPPSIPLYYAYFNSTRVGSYVLIVTSIAKLVYIRVLKVSNEMCGLNYFWKYPIK